MASTVGWTSPITALGGKQAKDLVAGKPPRAKVDQEHAADKAKK